MNIKQAILEIKLKYKTDKHVRQSVMLMLWNFMSMPLAIVTNIVVTRYLGAGLYGDYLYVQKVFDFTYIILGFGVLHSVNRAILLAKDDNQRREFYGSGYICLFFVYAVMCVALYIFVLLSPNIEAKGLRTIMMCVIPFSIIHLTSLYFEQVLPSSNKISELIVQRYFPRIIMFVMMLVLYIVSRKEHLAFNPMAVVWTIFWGTQFFVYLYVFKKIRPSIKNVKFRVKEILAIDKEFGIQVYFGNLFSTAFTALMPVFLSTFGEDNSGVGFYSLSLMLSQPLSFIPVVIATSHYQRFADYKSIPRKLMLTTFSISIAAMMFLWIVVTPFVNVFYTSEFSPVIYLTIISSIGTLLYGISDFFSRYLMSQGRGKALRNSSFIVGFVTLLMSVLLIPRLHELGASITHVGAGIVYFIIILYYYKKCVKDNLKNEITK